MIAPTFSASPADRLDLNVVQDSKPADVDRLLDAIDRKAIGRESVGMTTTQVVTIAPETSRVITAA